MLDITGDRTIVSSHWTGRTDGILVGDGTSSLLYDLPPLLRSLWCMCLELALVAHGETATKLALGRVLALDIELLATDCANHAVGQVKGHLRNRILGKIVVRLKLMEEFGGRNDIVICVVRSHDLALTLQRSSNEGLSGAMVLIWKAYLGNGALRRIRIDEDPSVALDEAVPLKVQRNALRVSDHVSVGVFGMLGLRVHDLHERSHTLLDGLNDVCFKLSEGILHADQILSVVVLL